ncbi:MAG: hypothetical protein MSA72_05395 [Lachnospiraceae bacterium]|nr:hypothetical protein [Lachnospiraceae bacterium]
MIRVRRAENHSWRRVEKSICCAILYRVKAHEDESRLFQKHWEKRA